jgi:Uma2 family endonuclease
MVTIPKLLTLEDFLRLPEEKPALEFEEGRVVQKVSPRGKHSVLQYAVSEIINRFAMPRKLARAFPELRATFGGRSYVPDVSVYRWDRIPVDVTGLVADEFLAPPDIVVEIVSPKQSVNALVRRCLWFVANGVHLAVLVDPPDQSVLIFRLNQAPSVRRGHDQIDFGDVLPGFSFTAQDLFDALSIR